MEQNRQNVAEQNALIVNGNGAPQEDVQEIDRVELFYALLNHWKLLLVAFIMGMVIMAGYYGMFVRETYKASTELYITNTDSVISLQDLQVGPCVKIGLYLFRENDFVGDYTVDTAVQETQKGVFCVDRPDDDFLARRPDLHNARIAG